jgi:hypothetical protein
MPWKAQLRNWAFWAAYRLSFIIMEVKTMKIDRQIILRVFIGLNVAGLLNGCTMMRDNMAKTTTDYNLVVEKAQNEMLLLNIVRASKRRPMYFTSLSSLRGKMTYSFGTGSTIPFGKIGIGTNGSYSVTPSVTYSTSPEFDLNVQNSKKFTRGIMTPVPMETIEYYWQQGWPKEMLALLFFSRMEEIDIETVLKNDPDSRDKGVDFRNFRDAIKKMDWDNMELVTVTPVGEKDTKEPKLQTLEEILKFALSKADNKDSQQAESYYVLRPKNKTKSNAKKYKTYIRSPEAILYYLGEIVRVENKKKDSYIPYIGFHKELPNQKPVPLFRAYKAKAEDKSPCVSVVYEGVRYIIPQAPDSNDGYCTDRSMHVLSLVSQLIGLQREVEEMPTTGVVSVIGQ